MNDQSIDRALREALDVSPSPDFVARVRTRIASEPAPRRAWGLWMPVAVGAVAAAIALAVLVKPVSVRLPAPSVREGKPDTTAATNVPLQPVPTVRLKPDATPVTTPTATTATATTPTPSYVVSAFRRTVVSRKEPEILISQSESAALRRLIARASEGQIVMDAASASASDASAELKPMPEIPPLKIDPVVPVNGEEGVRQ